MASWGLVQPLTLTSCSCCTLSCLHAGSRKTHLQLVQLEMPFQRHEQSCQFPSLQPAVVTLLWTEVFANFERDVRSERLMVSYRLCSRCGLHSVQAACNTWAGLSVRSKRSQKLHCRVRSQYAEVCIVRAVFAMRKTPASSKLKKRSAVSH